MISTTNTKPKQRPRTSYGRHLEVMQREFDRIAGTALAVFTTDAVDLWKLYLSKLPAGERQHHDCHACRRFVERYGGLVTIGESGITEPIVWGETGGSIYGASHAALRQRVGRAKVTGVFLATDALWGEGRTMSAAGVVWEHMSVRPPPALIMKKSPLQTPGQRAAEKREEFGIVCRALEEFSPAALDTALTIIESESLYRGEKIAGPARFLRDLHSTIAIDSVNRANTIWRAVATAPAGFCHPRASMIGTLLEDILAGLPHAMLKARFDAKMNPLRYQRPQAAPSAGNLARAEHVVATLRSSGALDRRFARIDDVLASPTVKLWIARGRPLRTPTPGPVFGHVTPKLETSRASGRAGMAVPATTITFDKFRRTVLPDAESVEVLTTTGAMPFLAMATAVDPHAPPIMQWDRDEQRNPLSWYVYPGGSRATDWNLQVGAWVRANAVVLLPFMQSFEDASHHGAGAVFILEGCRDLRALGGLALFPEILRSEYREIRSSIEAFSRAGRLAEPERASACGVDIRQGGTYRARVRVTRDGRQLEYAIDRWD